MNEKDKALEFKVGLFVFTGLMVIAVMVIKFGQIGQGFNSYYDLKVQFANASGLIKRADVQLAGARIGYVNNTPDVGMDATHIDIFLKIKKGAVIPRKTTFKVNSAGLLGDKFVEVVPNSDFDPKNYNPQDPKQIWNPGENIEGVSGGGLEALTKKGEIAVDKLNGELDELKKATVKINENLLSDANRNNLAATLSNLKLTSDTFVETSKNINAVVLNAQGAVDTAKKSMTSIDNTAGDVRKAVADGRKVIDSAGVAINSANEAIKTATHGSGLMASLLTDPKLSDNLRALSSNLRTHGILFYKDTAGQGATTSKFQVPQKLPVKEH
jgi:ABC-type transporter Mla subunit MlaD